MTLDNSSINFVSEALLAKAMAQYRDDPIKGDLLIHCACAQARDPLPLQRIAYKFYNRQRRFDLAHDFASRALNEASRQAGLPIKFEYWTRAQLSLTDANIASQAKPS